MKHKKTLSDSYQKYHSIQSKDLEAFEKDVFDIIS